MNVCTVRLFQIVLKCKFHGEPNIFITQYTFTSMCVGFTCKFATQVTAATTWLSAVWIAQLHSFPSSACIDSHILQVAS